VVHVGLRVPALDVATGGEGAAGAGDDDRFDRAVVAQLGRDVRQDLLLVSGF